MLKINPIKKITTKFPSNRFGQTSVGEPIKIAKEVAF